jgi:cobalt-zinc-cadmium efflux system membrane fusion protein
VEPLNARIAYNDNYTARVFSPIAGRVVRIVTETGKKVKAGSELLHLSSPDFSQGAADNMKAIADLMRKQEAFNRAKELLKTEGISVKDFETVVADLRQAEAEALRTKARMKNLLAGGASPTGDFVLRAPVSGVISERHVNAGSEVRPDASDPLFVITNPGKLWVQVDLPERQLNKVEIGRLVLVEVDAYPGESFLGKIKVIGGSLDPVTRRFQVRCEIDNPLLRLKPEMYARVTPIVDERSDLPRVPNSALVTQGLFSYLFVEISPGVLQRRRVTLSMQGSDFTYVKDGLKAGERVVTSGALLLNSELAGID